MNKSFFIFLPLTPDFRPPRQQPGRMESLDTKRRMGRVRNPPHIQARPRQHMMRIVRKPGCVPIHARFHRRKRQLHTLEPPHFSPCVT